MCYAFGMQYQHLSGWKRIAELSSLLDLSQPPKDLFVAGTWNPSLCTDCVAVIGTRRITEYGRRIVETIVPQLVFEGKTIVSGFMYGVDQYAHEICVANGGKTIAVLGWGINMPLTGEDKKLAESIISSGGLLMSEWEEQKPTLWTFPVRNRIVAALSREVIVVEAAQKSGSLITANIASKLKRKLWAVPGPITSRLSAGTHALISEGKASLWPGISGARVPISDDPILQIIGGDACTADEIARAMGEPVADVGAKLSLLLLEGRIVEHGGKYHVGKN